MAEVLRSGHMAEEHHLLGGLILRVSTFFSSGQANRPVRPQKHDRSQSTVSQPHYELGNGGWSAGGWYEEDPTPEEAMAALASLDKVDYAAAMNDLRQSAEERLAALDEQQADDG